MSGVDLEPEGLAGFECVIFDLDGTVSDTTSCIVASVDVTAARVEREPPQAGAIRHKVGLPLRQMLDELMPGLAPQRLDEAVAIYSATYVELAKHHERVFDGMEALIGRLHASGRRLAVCTGKGQAGAERAVGRMGLAHRFHTVHGIVPDTPGKPHPAVLLRALRGLRADPAHAVMIGDTTYDMHMACKVGVAACGVSWGVHPPAQLVAAGARWVASDVGSLSELLGASPNR